MKRGRYVAIKLEEDSMKMDKKSADFRIPRSEEWMDRRKIGGSTQTQRRWPRFTGSRSAKFAWNTWSRVNACTAHTEGVDINRASGGNYARGGRLAVEATISRVICDSSQQCRFIDVRKYRSSRSISAWEILSRSF